MIKHYIQIARFDHWFKNVFMLPGVVVAVHIDNSLLDVSLIIKLVVALLATGFIASSNYVINEILDAPKDRRHPVKKNRPVASGKIDVRIGYAQWILFMLVGLALALYLGTKFFIFALSLWVMGCIYNIPPIRSKEKPYIDVVSEAINNPIRLLLGWYATGTLLLPPISLILAYWMIGAYFMAAKRFGEYRMIGDGQVAESYRSSFRHYTEERLVVSMMYYLSAFSLFFGIFLIRYKMELILSIPLIAGFTAWYFYLACKEDSPVQYPEKLYREKGFLAYTMFVVLAALFLMVVDYPWLHAFFQQTIK